MIIIIIYHSTLFIIFQKFPRLKKYVGTCCDGETLRKAAPFSNDELNKFFLLGPDDDNSLLVRKCVAIMGVAGGVRGKDLRKMKQGSIKPIPGGYRVTFVACKQKGHVRNVK